MTTIRHGPFAGMPREVAVLAGVAVCVALGFGVVAPAIPVFARQFGVSRTAAGGVVSVFAAARFVSALAGGRLVDRFGPRRTLGTGLLIVAASSALAGLARNYLQLLLLRGVGGIGSAMFTVSAFALLLRSAPPDLRGRASGLFSGSFLLGGITGPALGGVVTGLSFRAPFFLYAGTLAAAFLVCLLLLAPDPEEAHPRSGAPAGAGGQGGAAARVTLPQALRVPAYRALLAAQFADQWSALGVRSALVPLFVSEVLHRSPTVTGLGFVVVAGINAAILLPAGKVADRRGRRPVLVGGCLLSASGMAVLAVEPTLAGYFAGLAIFGLGAGLLDVAPGAILGDVTGGRGGTAVAAYQMSGDAGTFLGPLVAGALADSVSYSAAFGATSGVLAVAAAAGLFAAETRPGRAPALPGAQVGSEVAAAGLVVVRAEPPAEMPAQPPAELPAEPPPTAPG